MFPGRMSSVSGPVVIPPGAAPPAPSGPLPPEHNRARTVLTVVGVVVLLAGLGLLGWVGFQYVGTNLISERAFADEKSGLRTKWAAEGSAGERGAKPAEPGPVRSARQTQIPGQAIALLRVPAFGEDYEVPILAGTDERDLDRGVGHYADSAQPGQVGNFALAGHRITHGEPFAKLLDLDRGEKVIVETRDAIYTYVIDDPPRDLTVPDTDTWVLDPVPGEPESKPSKALLTLTTCQDLFRSPDRSVGFGHLASTKIKG